MRIVSSMHKILAVPNCDKTKVSTPNMNLPLMIRRCSKSIMQTNCASNPNPTRNDFPNVEYQTIINGTVVLLINYILARILTPLVKMRFSVMLWEYMSCIGHWNNEFVSKIYSSPSKQIYRNDLHYTWYKCVLMYICLTLSKMRHLLGP